MSRPDVIVIGAGLAGLIAAITAADAGSSVLVVEKTGHGGGNAVYSGGSVVFAGTDLQAEAGIDDSPERLRRELIEVGKHLADERLVDAYVHEQLDTYEWLKGLGVDFYSVTLSGNQTVPRSHGVRVRPMMDTLQARAEADPAISFVFNRRAVHLVRQDGRVVGVQLETPEGHNEVRSARRSVILASGGFSHSRRTFASFAPRLMGATPLGSEAATGDGLYIAMEQGADLADMGSLTGTFGTSASIDGMPPEPILLIAMYRGAIVVNSDGRRFADESLSYKVIAEACLTQPGALGFQIFDQRVMASTDPDKLVNNFQGAADRGYVRTAETPEELARHIGVDADAFVQTLADYNRCVRDGGDQMGRVSLGSGFGTPFALDTPPYYAYPCTVGMPSTYGGIRVDPKMRVIDVSGQPIRGLVAAGEVTGGLHGGGYISGTSLGKSAIFGRVAGRTAASEAPSTPSTAEAAR